MAVYLKVRWNHTLPDEPIWLFSEIDSDRNEIRKVEFYLNGQFGYASNSANFGSTRLSVEPLPALEEIARDPQFEPIRIEESEFNKVWLQALNSP